MDYKKTNTPQTTVTRDTIELSQQTGNIYETVSIIAKRANQIAQQMKSDLFDNVIGNDEDRSKMLTEEDINFILS